MTTVREINIQHTAWEDERGWGLNPFKTSGVPEDASLNLHIVSLKPGFVRGNHYHTNATEWMLVYGGSAKFLSKPIRENTVKEIFIKDEKPVLLEIPPNVEHAVINESKNDVYLVVFSSSVEPDTIRCPSLFELKR